MGSNSNRVVSKMAVISATLIVAIVVTSSLIYFYYPRNPGPNRTTPSADFHYSINSFDFENGVVASFVVSSDLTWGIQNCPMFSGPSGDRLNCWGGNYVAGARYAKSLNSNMTLYTSLVNFTRVEMNFHLWVDIQPEDTLYVEFQNSTMWNTTAKFSGHLSTTAPLNQTSYTAWMNETLSLPSQISGIRFRLATSCCGPIAQGIFLDNVNIYGIGPKNYSVVEVWSSEPFATGDPIFLSAPVSIDGSAFYATRAAFLVTPGTHTITAASTFQNTKASLRFEEWYGVYPYLTVKSPSWTRPFPHAEAIYVFYVRNLS